MLYTPSYGNSQLKMEILEFTSKEAAAPLMSLASPFLKILKIMSYNFQSRKQILTLRGVYCSKKFHPKKFSTNKFCTPKIFAQKFSPPKNFHPKNFGMARKLVKSFFSRIKAQSCGPFWDNSFLFFLLFNLR